ncbi:MAG: hypothetical protein WAN36_12560, partial [Calditrichia bacterium]
LHAIYFTFGAQVLPGRVSVGVNAKYVRENMSDNGGEFDYKGDGLGADLGLLVRVNPWISLGAQIKDVNAKLKSDTKDLFDRGMTLNNKFPVSYRTGFYVISPLPWLRGAYDFEWSEAGEEKHHIGVEMISEGLAGRLGYDNDHFTFGGGLEINTPLGTRASLNYAFMASVIDEGSSHIFTWRLAF